MDLLTEAMRRKAAANGGVYSLHDLEADSRVSFSYISKVRRGLRHPSPDVIAALSRALDPYLPLDEALLTAGYAPRSPSVLRRILNSITDQMLRDVPVKDDLPPDEHDQPVE